MNTPLRLFTLGKAIASRGSRWLFSAVLAGITFQHVYAQVPIPVAQSLPYVVDFGSAHFTSYPAGLSVSRGVTASFTTTATAAEAFPDGDFTLTRTLDATQLTAPLSNIVNTTPFSLGSRPHSYLDGSNAKLLISLSARIWGVFWNVTTTGFGNIKVGYDLQLTERGSNNATANLDAVVFLQYRYNDLGNWITVSGSEWSTTGLTVGTSTSFSNLTLPGTANDGVKVNFRLIHYQTAEVTINDILSYAVDNISVTGAPLAKSLAVKSTNPATPTENFPFSVTVEAQNVFGTASTVATDENFTLTISSGTLTGTTVGKIPAGFASTVVSGLVINPSGSNITLSVVGSTLTSPGTSLVLNVASFSGASKIAFGSVFPESGSVYVAGRPFSLVLNTLNSANQTAQVSAATTFSVVGIGAILSGNTSVTIPAGGSSATITGIISASATTSLGFTISAISGDALTSISAANPITVIPAPSKLLLGAIPSNVKDNKPFSLVVSVANSEGTVLTVLSPTTITIAKISGTGSFLSNLPVVIPAGQSTATITGLKYSVPTATVSIKATVVAGTSLTDSDPANLTVGQAATKVVISSVLPSNTSVLTADKAISIRIKVVDDEGKAAFIPSAATLSFGVAAGTGSLSGTITGNTFAAGDSAITVRGLAYSKAESNVGINVAVSSGLSLAGSSIGGLSFAVDPNAGSRVLYKEDFEKTIKVSGQVNPALPGGLRMYNVDGKTAIASVYPEYGTNAYVLRRIAHRGYAPRTVDVPTVGNRTLFFDNSGSAFPDSNFVAFTTSYFDNNASLNPQADRWLVTPAVTLTGSNLKFSVQAMSFTSSGNFKDQFQLYFSQIAPGNSFVPGNWEAFNFKPLELSTATVAAQYFAYTLPMTYAVSLPSTFDNQVVYFAVRLNTPQGGGDRLAIDNLVVTSDRPTRLFEASDVVGKADIYPNPAKDEITLSFNQKEAGEAFLTLYDAHGKEYNKQSLGSFASGIQFAKASIQNTPEGFYVAKITTPNKVFISKLIIE